MNFLLLPLLLLPTFSALEKPELKKGDWGDGGRYEILFRTQKDGTQSEHGKARYYFANGKLGMSGKFGNGQRTGKWKAWWPDGTQSWMGKYKRGERIDSWYFYNEGGTQIDHLSGTWELVKAEECGGTIHLTGYTVNGTPQGFWQAHWWNGELFASGVRLNGLRSGAWTAQHPDGSPAPLLGSGQFNMGHWEGPPFKQNPDSPQSPSADLPVHTTSGVRPPQVDAAKQFDAQLAQMSTRLESQDPLTEAEKEAMLDSIVSPLGGHGLGWSLDDNSEGMEVRAEAIKSARTLTALYGASDIFWRWKERNTAIPKDPHVVSRYYLELPFLNGIINPPTAEASRIYGARIAEVPASKSAEDPKRVAVKLALDWFASNQRDDGWWVYGDEEIVTLNAGPASLVLLCYLGAGYSPLEGPYSEVISKGLQAILDGQEKDGALVERAGHSFIYYHCLATLTLAEAYGRTGHPAFLQPLEKAVDYIVRARAPYGGWRYDVPSAGDSDTSVTAWAYQALYAASIAGLDIPEDTNATVLDFIDSLTDTSTGRVGYIGPKAGGRSARVVGLNDEFSYTGEPMTGAGLAIRCLAAGNARLCAKHVNLISRSPLSWESKEQDSYYAYYGSLALSLYPKNGSSHSRARKWTDNAAKLILKNQIKKGATAGSWDPTDVWGVGAGRIYTTAMYTLSLENSWRYIR